MKKLHATDNLKDLVSYSVKLTIVLCWNGFGVVSIWRGLWVLQDYFLFPDNPALSAWASGAISIVMIIIGLLIRRFVNYLAASVDLWNYSAYPSLLEMLFSANDLEPEKAQKALYYTENQIETPNFLDDKRQIPHVNEAFVDVSHMMSDSINESTEGLPLLLVKEKKSKEFKLVRRVVGKILQIMGSVALFVSSFTFSSFVNLMILNARLAVWVTVKSYYWFLGAAAVAYHRWVWSLWDVYTDGDYFAVFIIVSIIIPTLMLLPVEQEFHTIGGTPISPELFDVANLTIFGSSEPQKGKVEEPATTNDEESEIESPQLKIKKTKLHRLKNIYKKKKKERKFIQKTQVTLNSMNDV